MDKTTFINSRLKTQDSKPHEECGIVAIYSKKGKDVAPLIYNALIALQHRGQDAAGIAVFNNKIEVRKNLGLVSEAFKPEDLEIKGNLGIGHTRYPTSGSITIAEVQPFVYEDIAIAHNGHVSNYNVIKKELQDEGVELRSTVDSEIIALLLKKKIENGLEPALKYVMEKIDGAYSNVAIVKNELIAFRDPHAIRPLVYGENDDLVCFASESCALDINNIDYAGDIEAGEYATIKNNRIVKKAIAAGVRRHCMFEYVYFARPDSVINKLSVLEVRKRLGGQLAKEYPVSADVVVPIPDTARSAAEAFSRTTGISMEEGLIKNRYVGRTFIMPSQDKRSQAVRLKLNPVKSIIANKRVVLIDDSIVRGTTLREIVKLVRNAGAKEVHLRITCPPIKAPCFYGVDMATYKELIASNKGVEEIRRYLGVETLGYLSIEGLKKAIGLPVCTGCLNEDYITPYAKKLAKEKRDDELKCG